MIELVGVSKRYGTKLAVDRLDLTIRDGELFALLGPNGAGKTTSIKMMCGLLFPSEGQVRIGGHDMVTDGDAGRRLIAYVPDQPYLYEKLSGREFLLFIADMYGIPRDEATEEIARVIQLFDLSTFIDDLTERYSHGMRQRTVFAAALVHRPRVLIVDEPTVGLDPQNIRRLKDVLRAEAKRGTAVCLSTHSLDVAQELADRIGIIHGGRLACVGTLSELRQRAANDGSLEDVFLKITEEELAPAATTSTAPV
jgi:ABC-2 type transport system ATP-binding protein